MQRLTASITKIAFFLILLGSFAPSLQAATIHDSALRKRLAITYAPEIHQDQDEVYGLSSIAYLLRRSSLRAVIQRCPAMRKKKPPHANLGTGAQIASITHPGVVTWKHKNGTCERQFHMRATKDPSRRKRQLGAHNRVFLQFENHTPATLLKGKHRLAITPTVAYHAYESQTITCKQRNFFGFCQQYQVYRYYVIQYFVSLMFNEACNEHEGEHEGIVVLLNANAFDRAKQQVEFHSAILKIGFYGHYHTKLVMPKQVSFVRMTHPVAYMGKGGHALYPKAKSSNLLFTFARELRAAMKRTCRKRGRYARLIEHHRGGGVAYRTWVPPQGKPDPKYKAATYLPKVDQKSRAYLQQQPAFSAACILAKKHRGVRLCDVRANPHNNPCCLQAKPRRYTPWARFTGRWGHQEKFASTLAGAAAAQVGRFLKRWPLASSMGNSGPFGPRWIHASTWRWLNPLRAPAAASPRWR